MKEKTLTHITAHSATGIREQWCFGQDPSAHGRTPGLASRAALSRQVTGEAVGKYGKTYVFAVELKLTALQKGLPLLVPYFPAHTSE